MKVTQRKKVIFWSGAAGLGLLALGIWASRQNRALAGLGRGGFKQAPIVGSYNGGNMRTVLRASNQMPIEQRIATIQDLIHKSVQDGTMRQLALQLTRSCPERDYRCEAQMIYNAIKSRIRYTGDIGPIRHPDGKVEGIDLYQSARRTWFDMQGGDCDDHAILASTLLALNGIEPRLRVVRQRQDPDWSHIFAGAMLNGKFVALDTTLPGNRSFDKEGVYVKGVDFKAVDFPA